MNNIYFRLLGSVLFLFLLSSSGIAQTSDFVIVNPGRLDEQGTASNLNQRVWSTPSTSTGSVLGKIPPNQYTVARSRTGTNNEWAVIDFPGTTASGAVTAYVSLRCPQISEAGALANMMPSPQKGYVRINVANTLIRANSTGTTNVTISGSAARGFQNQLFAVDLLVGTRYKIYLPLDHCSSTVGYVDAADVVFTPAVNASTPHMLRPSVAIDNNAVTSNSITLSWLCNGASSVSVYNYSNNNNLGTVPQGGGVISGLTANTQYNLYFVANNSFSNSCPIWQSVQTKPAAAGNPVADFTMLPSPATINNPVSFNNLATNYASVSWNFGDGSPASSDINPSHTYTTAGTYNVVLTATNTSGNHTKTLSLVVSASPQNEVVVGNIQFLGDNITTVSAGVFQLSGNVKIKLKNKPSGCTNTGSDISLVVNAPITVNTNTKKLTGTGRITVPSVKNTDRNLYNGVFGFDIDSPDSNPAGDDKLVVDWTIVTLLGQEFNLSSFDIPLDGLKVLCDGVSIYGKLIIPEDWAKDALNGGVARADVSGVSLRRSGIWLDANIHGENIKIGNKLLLKVADIGFQSQPVEKLTGSAEMHTELLKINLYTVMLNRKIDTAGIRISPLTSDPVPLGNTGLKIVEAIGGVGHPTNSTMMRISMTGTLAPISTTASLQQIQVAMVYKLAPRVFDASAQLTYMNALINAGLHIDSTLIKVYGNAAWYNNMITAYAKFRVNRQNNVTKFQGLFGANVKRPADVSFIKTNWLRWVIENGYSSGQTIAETNNYLDNVLLTGYAYAYLPFGYNQQRISYNLYWPSNGSGFVGDFATGNEAIPSAYLGLLDPNNPLWTGLRTGSTSAAADGYHGFFLEKATETLTIEAKYTSSLPTLEIYRPGGDMVNVSNYVAKKVMYNNNTTDKWVSFIFKSPKIGEYKIHLVGADSLVIFRENMRPTIKIASATNNTGAKTLQVNWTDSDPDDDAQISLFLDNDRKDADGYAVVDDLSEDSATDSYTINYGNVMTGDYYIGARIIDAAGHAYVSYFDTPYRLITNNAPNTPVLSTVDCDGEKIYGTFNRNNANPLGEISYALYYSTTSPVTFSAKSVGIQDSVGFDIQDLIEPGKVYYVAISAFDTHGRESNLSNELTVDATMWAYNNWPSFDAQTIPHLRTAGSSFTHTLLATDADFDPLEFSLPQAPAGMTINPTSGQINWSIPSTAAGFYFVKAKVKDIYEDEDSIMFQVLVLGNGNNKAHVNLSKTLYVNYGDQGIVNIYDADANTNNETKQTVNVRLFSKSDLTGINLVANETGTDSREFEAAFTIGASSVGSQLQAMAGDSIFVEYTDATSGAIVRRLGFFTQFAAAFDTTIQACAQPSFFVSNSKGDNLQYAWSFGDGNTSTERNPSHTYNAGGTYTATLSISDADGHVASVSKTIVVDCIVLPTEIEISANAQSNGNEVSWSIESQVAIAGFEVQSSENASEFSDVAYLPASTASTYTWLDRAPASSNMYYRVKVISMDGQASFSNVVNVLRDAKNSVSTFPNPAAEVLNVKFVSVSAQAISLRVFDAKGTLVMEVPQNAAFGENLFELQVGDLQAGNYQLQIITDQGSMTKAWVKQ